MKTQITMERKLVYNKLKLHKLDGCNNISIIIIAFLCLIKRKNCIRFVMEKENKPIKNNEYIL